MTALDKKISRSHFRQVRQAIPSPQREADSAAIAQRLLQHPAWTEARSLFCYQAMGSEVDTQPLMRLWLASGRTLAVPHLLDARQMQAVVLTDLQDGQSDPHRPGSWIPREVHILEQSPDLALVPGLAFTLQGYRLGQGGGCYDHYLAQHPQTLRIAVAFDSQIALNLPREAHDVTMHWIITPTRTVRCSEESATSCRLE